MSQIRILLIQLASNGDCLFVTAIARQIKEIDHPGCHLSWLIGSKYAPVLSGNKYVDEIIQIPLTEVTDIENQRNKIDEHIKNIDRKFDRIFITDFVPANKKNVFGPIRSILFRNYPHRIKGNPQPVICLTDTEKNNVELFCKKNEITDNTINILFECEPLSQQSPMNFERSRLLAEYISGQNPNIKFILSSNRVFKSTNSKIIDGSVITWRENAELANHCQLLIGCSSGISWLCTSSWTKPIKTIQVINSDWADGLCSASMKVDFKFFNIDDSNVIELSNPTDELLKGCVVASIDNFSDAKKKYDTDNYKIFSNYKLLKEAHMPYFEKLAFSLKYLFTSYFVETFYRSVKPDWFAPKRWFGKIINQL